MQNFEERQKIIHCFTYGTLRNIFGADEETWYFESAEFTYAMINSTFIQSLDDLSMEGWDLVCQGQNEYILRKPAKKKETVTEEDTEEPDEDET